MPFCHVTGTGCEIILILTIFFIVVLEQFVRWHNSCDPVHWRIREALVVRAPGPVSSIFMQFLATNLPCNRLELPLGLTPHLEILDPPLQIELPNCQKDSDGFKWLHITLNY